ncbi:hypothetical protein [Mesorhizobium escarrei]|uniref:Terminase large subunit gp17-like C-terminal domain-containing protein n=1 Tax=Mesorhizobium escarrei TaxID=666018 RepID=A0ABM9DIR6_9HYPH|nr:hypothetical protein [Mesorhizobium escarrei]CAH2396486.1 hypothetical protein MES5069_1360007 [Mesorhizobium escarrei]
MLQPGRFGPAEIEQLKQSTPSHIFATQFQQRPTAISAGTIRREDFLPFDLPAPPGEIVCSWDLASSANPTSSYSVCLVFAYNEHGSYLIDVFRGREGYSQLKDIAFAMDSRYRPRLHLIENASLGSALASDLKMHGVNAIPIPTGSTSKSDRLQAQMHQIKGQRVFLHKAAPWLENFLDELVAFPHGPRDEQVDALTQYLKWYGEVMSAPPAPPIYLERNSARRKPKRTHRGFSHKE